MGTAGQHSLEPVIAMPAGHVRCERSEDIRRTRSPDRHLAGKRDQYDHDEVELHVLGCQTY